MKAKKELGQNFLKDPQVIDDLIGTSKPRNDDVYLEIGPGHGAITQRLAPLIKKLIGVEIDPDLCYDLSGNPTIIKYSVEIVQQDVLAENCIGVLIHRCKIKKVLGSLPYQITSPLLHRLSQVVQIFSLDSITLLVQKEVAQKITAQPPHAFYLSNFVQTYFDVKLVRDVSRQSFRPIPKVDGSIISLKPLDLPLSSISPNAWSAFLHQGFQHPRQMIRKSFDEKILKRAGINPTARPGEIKNKQWLKLFKIYD